MTACFLAAGAPGQVTRFRLKLGLLDTLTLEPCGHRPAAQTPRNEVSQSAAPLLRLPGLSKGGNQCKLLPTFRTTEGARKLDDCPPAPNTNRESQHKSSSIHGFTFLECVVALHRLGPGRYPQVHAIGPKTLQHDYRHGVAPLPSHHIRMSVPSSASPKSPPKDAGP